MPEIANWIWDSNLQPLVDVLARLVGYDLSPDEWDIIRRGVAHSDTDASPARWYEYEFHGNHVAKFALGRDGGTSVIQVRLDVPAAVAKRAEFAVDLMQEFHLSRDG